MNYAELISESEDELKQLEKRQKLVQFQKRIQFLLLLKSQPAITQAKAGQGIGWQLRQSQKIWQLYREGGLGAVLHKPKGWGFGKLSSQQIAQLQNYLAEFGGYSLQEIMDYLEQSFGVAYSTSGVSALCCRLKIKLKTARPSNAKKDAAQVETYKKSLPN
ncbi:MAG TPA: winged helix-turn-helix domain-containing protein [Chlamydiales bacterium]|jgi:transposase|nr:winged helix-turn-helix domain-containing protein [Chlamydiales bacterium]